jgi:hypothetical protein
MTGVTGWSLVFQFRVPSEKGADHLDFVFNLFDYRGSQQIRFNANSATVEAAESSISKLQRYSISAPNETLVYLVPRDEKEIQSKYLPLATGPMDPACRTYIRLDI